MYHTQSNSFSLVFAMANGHRGFEEGEMYSFGSSSPAASPVDCTLSLGTPSTRMSGEKLDSKEKKRSSYMSGFGWNILPKNTTSSQPASAGKGHRSGGSGGGGGDPLLARRCANCDTTSTPLWRNGPRGPKSLCNACGIRFKKEERRATAAASTSNGGSADAQYVMNAPWAAAAPAQHYKTAPCYSSPYGNEFRFAENDVVDYHDSDPAVAGGGIPFLSWRVNVTDRANFVHDFTR